MIHIRCGKNIVGMGQIGIIRARYGEIKLKRMINRIMPRRHHMLLEIRFAKRSTGPPIYP